MKRRLTIEQVREMRRLYATGGVSVRELGKQFGVSKSLVHRILKGEIYRDAEVTDQ